MKNETVTVNIEATMNSRWVPHFIGMLETMERLGNVGSSRMIGFFSDGDGDFRPKFSFDKEYDSAKSQNEQTLKCSYVYDAG